MGDEATRVMATSVATNDRYAGLYMVFSTVGSLSVGSVQDVGSVGD